MIRQAALIKGIEGIELVGSWDITESNVSEMKKLLASAASRSFQTCFRKTLGTRKLQSEERGYSPASFGGDSVGLPYCGIF